MALVCLAAATPAAAQFGFGLGLSFSPINPTTSDRQGTGGTAGGLSFTLDFPIATRFVTLGLGTGFDSIGDKQAFSQTVIGPGGIREATSGIELLHASVGLGARAPRIPLGGKRRLQFAVHVGKEFIGGEGSQIASCADCDAGRSIHLTGGVYFEPSIRLFLWGDASGVLGGFGVADRRYRRGSDYEHRLTIDFIVLGCCR